MFKLLNKTKHDRRGFTIVELLVTLTILLLILSLTAQLWSSIYKRFDMVEKQFLLQSQIEYIVAQFQRDATKTSLSTATRVDLFYEDQDTIQANKTLASCSELGTFTEDETTGELTFAKATNQYTYYFTFNGYFYSLAPKHTVNDDGSVNIESNNVAIKFCSQFDEPLKMDIKFSVGVDAFQWDTTQNKEAESPTNADGTAKAHKYLDAGITVSIKSNREYLPAKYDLNSSYSFDNMLTNKRAINCNSDEGDFVTSTYSAGWDLGTEAQGYPSSDKLQSDLAYPNLSKTANVIKFISYNDSLGGALDADTGTTETAFTCGTRWLMAGTDMEGAVVNTLREFRDNTLKGTYLGDIIIDKYYNEWSPAIIALGSRNDAFKRIGRELVTDTAVIIAAARG